MSTCDCFTGTPGDRNHESKGTIKTLHGLNVYQTLAAADVKGEVLFLPDVFGLSTHSKILADEYASFGRWSLAGYRATADVREIRQATTRRLSIISKVGST
ncbi:hypothetical protein QWA68_015434 [Fusarium oxysporum]|nr:hypothetical protein QWA68_015434 [Fusarium oxysporum]